MAESDIGDMLIGLTDAVWSRRDVGRLASAYRDSVTVCTPLSASHDGQAVLHAALEWLHVFPDRRVLTEDVLVRGTYASQRLISQATHLGDGRFGKPTGRRVRFRQIVERVCHEGAIAQEWSVTDHAALLAGLGLDVREGARLFGDALAAPLDLAGRWAGGDLGNVPDGPAAQLLAGYRAMWSGGNAGIVPGLYHHAASLHGPGGGTCVGEAEIRQALSGYRAAFPDGEMTVHQATVRDDPAEPRRIALRWSLVAGHDGFGRFGPPTHRQVVMLGMTHLELRGGLILREFLLIDELSVWTQILG